MGFAVRVFENDPKEDFRHMIHDKVDEWVDQIIDEVFEDGKEPTMMKLSQLFSEAKQKFFGACFQSLIEQKYAGLFKQGYAPCRHWFSLMGFNNLIISMHCAMIDIKKNIFWLMNTDPLCPRP